MTSPIAVISKDIQNNIITVSPTGTNSVIISRINNLIFYVDAGDTNSYAGSGTTWSDLSGNNYNATLVSSPTFNSSGYFTFDGSTDYATLGNISGLDIGNGNDITVSVWLKTNSVVSKALISKYQTDTAEGGWVINLLNTGVVNIGLKDSAGNSITKSSVGTVNNSVWREVSVIFRGSAGGAVSIYIDGNFDSDSSTLAGNRANNSRALLIGGVHTPTNVINPQYSGDISIVKIYNTALTAQQILNNYNGTKGRFGL